MRSCLYHVLCILVALVVTPLSKAQEYNILDFGAVGDGTSDNTGAVQKAIDKCTETGGRVVFPEGTFATGTVFLKSNVTIWLSEKAIWLGYPDLKAFPDIPANEPSRLDVTPWKAMVYAFDQENIAITGPGTFYPQGEHAVFQNNIVNSKDRPYGMHIVKCRNVRITDIQMQHSAFWMARFLHCDRLRISGIRIFNHANLNNDGVDIDGCRDVIVSDCHIDSSDDALCFKSEGNRICQDVVVTNCILSSHASALKWGTGSIGGFRNFAVSNLVIRPSKATKMIHPANSWVGLNAIDLGNVDGGIMKDITIDNIMIDSIETPVFIRLGARKDRSWLENDNNPDGYIENITMSNITATQCGNVSSSITGYPGNNIRNVRLHNIFISTTGRGEMKDTTTNIVEPTTNYPINRMFNTNLPSYGLYVRHVDGLVLDNVTLNTSVAEPRSAVYMENVTNTELFSLRSDKSNSMTPLIQLKDTRQVTITGDTHFKDITQYLKISGNSGNIRLVNSPFSHLQQSVPPLDFKAMSVVEGSDYVRLSWSKAVEDAGMNEFVIYRDGKELIRTRDISVYDANIEEKKEYTYSIRSCNGLGDCSERVSTTVKTQEDREALRLMSLKIVDANTLLLGFSEPLKSDNLDNKARYAFTPALDLKNARMGEHPHQLVLTVRGMQRDVTYRLKISDLEDLSLSGNRVRSMETTFTDAPVIARWTFDEGEGTEMVDEVNGITGIINNPVWVKGKEGKALYFDGKSAFVSIPNHEQLNVQDNMAISFWMKLADPDLSVYSRIINKRKAWNAPHGYELEYNPAKNRFNLSGASQTGMDQGVVIREMDDQWHHVVAMIKNGKAQFYVDGEEVGIDHDVALPTVSEVPLTIGATWRHTDLFHGSLDELTLFNRALSMEEVSALFQRSIE